MARIQLCRNGCGATITVLQHEGKWKPFCVSQTGEYTEFDANGIPVPHDCPQSPYNLNKSQNGGQKVVQQVRTVPQVQQQGSEASPLMIQQILTSVNLILEKLSRIEQIDQRLDQIQKAQAKILPTLTSDQTADKLLDPKRFEEVDHLRKAGDVENSEGAE